jgi:hypothetical protein
MYTVDPKQITNQQRRNRLDICNRLLNQYHDTCDVFLSCNVTETGLLSNTTNHKTKVRVSNKKYQTSATKNKYKSRQNTGNYYAHNVLRVAEPNP